MKSFENPEKRRKSNGGRRRARIHSDGRVAGETTARSGDAVRSRFGGCPYPSLVFLYDAPYLFGSVLPVLTRGDAGTYGITKSFVVRVGARRIAAFRQAPFPLATRVRSSSELVSKTFHRFFNVRRHAAKQTPSKKSRSFRPSSSPHPKYGGRCRHNRRGRRPSLPPHRSRDGRCGYRGHCGSG